MTGRAPCGLAQAAKLYLDWDLKGRQPFVVAGIRGRSLRERASRSLGEQGLPADPISPSDFTE